MNQRVQKTVKELAPIDDIFFSKLAEDEGFCEEILQLALEMPDLKVVSCATQKSLRNIQGRSVVVDVLCETGEGQIINVEVQKENDDDHQKRVRYNGSNMDTALTEKGIKFADLPDVYVVYISRFDVFSDGKTIYHVDRVIRENGKVVYNGFHEIYINTQIDDGSDIADLMKIYKSVDVLNDERFPRTCNRIKSFKIGRRQMNMCNAVEEYAKEYAKEHTISIARKMLLKGSDVAEVHEITELDIDEIQKLKSELA